MLGATKQKETTTICHLGWTTKREMEIDQHGVNLREELTHVIFAPETRLAVALVF